MPGAVQYDLSSEEEVSTREANEHRPVNRVRLAAVRRGSRLLTKAFRTSTGRKTLGLIRNTRAGTLLLDSMVGFRCVFPDMAAAEAKAREFLPRGHDHVDNTDIHLALSRVTRPSDYPVLLYLSRVITQDHLHVFDLGGNVGNLYYSYRRHLAFPKDTRWTVCDLECVIETGRRIAREEGPASLRFTTDFAEASGCDVFLASGCLHYFDRPLAQMLSGLRKRPPHVIVNRTPLIESGAVVTVQDNESFLTPVTLYGKKEMVASMAMLGYEKVDGWAAPERSMRIPCYPEFDADSYSGLYFALRR